MEKATEYVYKMDGNGKRGRFVNTLNKLIEQYTIANERQNGAEQELRNQSPRRPSNPSGSSSSLDDLTHQAKSGLEW